MAEYIILDEFLSEDTKESADAQGHLHELVRCKDCKNKEKNGISEGFHYCNINGLQVTDEWFCADGERKDSKQK